MNLADVSGIVPPELLKWADIPLILLCVIISVVLRPQFDPEQGAYAKWQEMFRGDKIMLLPLLIGLLIGTVVELTTDQFDLNMAIRRSLTTGCGAVAGYRGAKLWIPWIFRKKDEDDTTGLDNKAA